MDDHSLTQWDCHLFGRAGVAGIEYRRLDGHGARLHDPIQGLTLRADGSLLDLGRVERLSCWPISVETATKWVVRLAYHDRRWESQIVTGDQLQRIRQDLDRRVSDVPPVQLDGRWESELMLRAGWATGNHHEQELGVH